MVELAPDFASGRRVLVVEDEAQICDVLADLLEEAGLEPVCTHNDQEAYDTLRRDTAYACMIVDVNLGPGTTGYDVARFARQIDPALPVIFVSGQSNQASFQAFGVPGSLFVPKPFRPDELLAQVHKLIGDNDDEP